MTGGPVSATRSPTPSSCRCAASPGRRAARPAASLGRSPNLALGRRVPLVPRAGRRAVRRRGGQRPRLRGRAAPGRVAGRARPRQDDVLLRRQPRAAHAADAAARPDRRRPGRPRRAAAATTCREQLRAGHAQRPAAAAPGQRPARLRQHRGRAGPARCAWRPTSPRSPPSWPGSSGPPPSGPGCGSRSTARRWAGRPTSTRGCGRRSSSTCSPTRSSTRSSAASASPCAADDDGFALTVSDTGVGIVAEELPQLFQRFHRVSGARRPHPRGHRHRPGAGARAGRPARRRGAGGERAGDGQHASPWRCRSAAPDAVDDGPDAAASPSEAARGEAASWEQDTARPGGPRRRPRAAGSVLVVDDNADMRAYLTRLLGPHWTVRTTANGEEALAAVAERRPTSC